MAGLMKKEKARWRALRALTPEQIQSMPSGRALDRLVHRFIANAFWDANHKPAPVSKDAHAALDLLDLYTDSVSLYFHVDGITVCNKKAHETFNEEGITVVVSGYDGASVALAISRFLLLECLESAPDPDDPPVSE